MPRSRSNLDTARPTFAIRDNYVSEDLGILRMSEGGGVGSATTVANGGQEASPSGVGGWISGG